VKQLVVFDLDGTLAPSKSQLETETVDLVRSLLRVAKVAIISGGDWPQFSKQVLGPLPEDRLLDNLSLLPTCGTKFYRHDNDWSQLYSEDLTAEEKDHIQRSLTAAVTEAGFAGERAWGNTIEDRGSQITLSALGQDAPLDEKSAWDPDLKKRTAIKAILDPLIPEYSARVGGTTSIDITRSGIDKGYGMNKLRDVLDIPLSDMIFVGDSLFVGGNDRPAMEAGVAAIAVDGPAETRLVIQAIVVCLAADPPSICGEGPTLTTNAAHRRQQVQA
jgi:phosphomannomutase